MITLSPELKVTGIYPCPFCGGPGKLVVSPNKTETLCFVSVQCEMCSSKGRTFCKTGATPANDSAAACQKAIRAWNMRYPIEWTLSGKWYPPRPTGPHAQQGSTGAERATAPNSDRFSVQGGKNAFIAHNCHLVQFSMLKQKSGNPWFYWIFWTSGIGAGQCRILCMNILYVYAIYRR